MNPIVIIVALVLAIALWSGGDYTGHKRGINEQKVADQAQFDKINQDTDDQKAEANALYRKRQEENIALMTERDQLKTKLEKDHAANQKTTDDLRARYAGLGLRFTAEAPRLGNGGGCAQSAGADSASAEPAAVIQLPDAIAANLRQLAFDADQLADDYRKGYGYINQMK